MNSNQLQGTVKDAAGKVQDAVVSLTGDLDCRPKAKFASLPAWPRRNMATASIRSPGSPATIRSARW